METVVRKVFIRIAIDEKNKQRAELFEKLDKLNQETKNLRDLCKKSGHVMVEVYPPEIVKRYVCKWCDHESYDVSDTVCHCYNTECMHHRGGFCMAAQFNCEDRQTER